MARGLADLAFASLSLRLGNEAKDENVSTGNPGGKGLRVCRLIPPRGALHPHRRIVTDSLSETFISPLATKVWLATLAKFFPLLEEGERERERPT